LNCLFRILDSLKLLSIQECADIERVFVWIPSTSFDWSCVGSLASVASPTDRTSLTMTSFGDAWAGNVSCLAPVVRWMSAMRPWPCIQAHSTTTNVIISKKVSFIFVAENRNSKATLFDRVVVNNPWQKPNKKLNSVVVVHLLIVVTCVGFCVTAGSVSISAHQQ
jgi:hypothetical protein